MTPSLRGVSKKNRMILLTVRGEPAAVAVSIPPAPATFAWLRSDQGRLYAMLILGLSLIFGLLNIINFAHGTHYMQGAFCA